MSVPRGSRNELKEFGPSCTGGGGVGIALGFNLANGGDEGDDAVADGAGVFTGEDGEEFGFEGGLGGFVEFGKVTADAFAEDDGGYVADGVVLFGMVGWGLMETVWQRVDET